MVHGEHSTKVDWEEGESQVTISEVWLMRNGQRSSI